LVADIGEALGAATGPPGGVATLIVPQDRAWLEVGASSGGAMLAADPTRPDPDVIRGAAATLRAAGGAGLLWLGGRALRERGLAAAARIAAATGCRARHDPFPARLQRGAGLPSFDPLPYFPEQAVEDLAGVTVAVLAGAPAPVAFFGYRDGVSELLPAGCEVVRIDPERGWADDALDALADELDAGPAPVPDAAAPTERPTGELSAGSLGRAVAAVQPEGAIVVNEAATTSRAWHNQSAGAPPHTELTLTGGAIGQGLPCAVGAAIARPERRVIALEADGSGLYTPQAMWTMAREGLEVTVVVCANRKYRILQHELTRMGIERAGLAATALTELEHPHPDWVSLAQGFGVPGVAVDRADDLVRELDRALAEPGPALIEAIL
jgi:acetolactate synthase-1/2/3 large subunit